MLCGWHDAYTALLLSVRWQELPPGISGAPQACRLRRCRAETRPKSSMQAVQSSHGPGRKWPRWFANVSSNNATAKGPGSHKATFWLVWMIAKSARHWPNLRHDARWPKRIFGACPYLPNGTRPADKRSIAPKASFCKLKPWSLGGKPGSRLMFCERPVRGSFSGKMVRWARSPS